MSDKPGFFNLSTESPLYQLIISILIIVGIGSLLTFVLVFAGMKVFDADLTVLSRTTESLNDKDVHFLRYLLIIQDIALLLIPAGIIMSLLKPESGLRFPELKIPRLNEIGLVIILTFCIFPVISFTGEINASMHLPPWLSGVENWMTDQEESADAVINSLINSNTFWGLMLNLFTIALLPAIAEEMVFRGVFQKIFIRFFKSGHIAIWVTAFIFSAVHFQFFGFIPRFILGLIFGYLFFWSGTLWLPVISHFVNNAFPVILANIDGAENLNESVNVPLWKQAIALPVWIVIVFVILFYFRNRADIKMKSINHGVTQSDREDHGV